MPHSRTLPILLFTAAEVALRVGVGEAWQGWGWGSDDLAARFPELWILISSCLMHPCGHISFIPSLDQLTTIPWIPHLSGWSHSVSPIPSADMSRAHS